MWVAGTHLHGIVAGSGASRRYFAAMHGKCEESWEEKVGKQGEERQDEERAGNRKLKREERRNDRKK